jgi:hypothetical protein
MKIANRIERPRPKLKTLAVALLVAGAFGCSDASKTLGPSNSDISGLVQQITVASDGSGQVRLAILGSGPDGGSGEHLFLVVNPGTPISLATKPGGHTGSISDLATGEMISANVDPVIIDTFPPQYLATEIQIGSGGN